MIAFSNFTVKLISFPVSTIDMTLAVAETLNPNKPNQNHFQFMLTTYRDSLYYVYVCLSVEITIMLKSKSNSSCSLLK